MRLGPGGSTQLIDRTLLLESGDEQNITLDLEPGEYMMFCSVVEEVSGETVSHQAEGMQATFVVTSNPEPEGETRAR